MSKIISFEESEKKAMSRENQIESFLEQANIGLSVDQQQMLLQILHNTTGDNYFIGKKKKPTDRVKFVQIIMDNYNYLSEIEYLTTAEKAFLMDLIPYVEFKTNILVERASKENEFDSDSATPTYLAKKLNRTRGKVSQLMNGLMKKGLLAVAETGTTTEDGRICTSRTWFVNPNIMCCSPKDGVDKATQRIFKKALRNFLTEDGKKHKLPIYLF
ncbi:MarR family transcriptional regulator [Bacillus cereus]|uniref:MarR family transcriptional regulator n=1 Tax=Bacillus cereus TaxID=1396 RepID=UPI000BF5CE40|nr:helix-turn-helix domain-containing protein [Bacillus cereus]EKS7877217.1 MarR family transcriptional regulator [Bacillus cereus]MBK4743997.1 MarR family transcriptional regulator [Bacillus cereus]PES29143.1 MarR family transcriptional regulator [Bacillus cereus]PET82294.1 MarR family transcriptional regulator [Bacillus cereus]PGS50538.1 MarR family transcriptional regulator [Bacillus cereus]